ncbi:tripartite tricarboxylate transporter TctB family protein [Flavimaricola marinus]|uniref:Tripartite tricarboxylate transporter TctB family protein n=1 Tax=Flavimaricola marinus TaxID=1819565 RepID=A0A238LGT3_9RHOB|nr:tripartite tricarboxylate transporter TctB family protein [Flavimaricola marinus]SMY08828.1 Tripartite tricarboxylate transporter TctB family protein [Flavimaricola marinus]
MYEGRKDIIGGALLIAAGATLAVHCYTSYELGSLRRMGTGFFPMLAGALLAILGGAVALPPLLRGVRPGAIGLPPLRATLFVIAAVGAFALLVRPFGLFPAIAGLAALASLASPERTPPRDLGLMIAVLCLLAWIVFGLGMSLGLRMLNWPW